MSLHSLSLLLLADVKADSKQRQISVLIQSDAHIPSEHPPSIKAASQQHHDLKFTTQAVALFPLSVNLHLRTTNLDFYRSVITSHTAVEVLLNAFSQ